MSSERVPVQPLVSVLVPVYNGAAFIGDALRSVLAQTYENFQCIVIDNCSTDDTSSIVDKFMREDQRIRLLYSDEFLGIYGNHNRALAAIPVEARYVKFLHADDWMVPDCLERMTAVAERHPGVGVVGGWRLLETEIDLNSLPTDQEVFSGIEIVRRSLTGGPYVTGSPSSLLLRTSLFDRDRPFYDESIWHSDTEAIYAALLRSDLGFVHEVMTFTRLHPGANTPFSDKTKTYAPENILMLCRHGPGVLSEREYRRQLTLEIASYGWFQAKQLLKPSRHLDPQFRGFHLDAIQRIRRELPARNVASQALRAISGLVRLQGVIRAHRSEGHLA